MQRRRLVSHSFEERLTAEKKRLEQQAEGLPPGAEGPVASEDRANRNGLTHRQVAVVARLTVAKGTSDEGHPSPFGEASGADRGMRNDPRPGDRPEEARAVHAIGRALLRILASHLRRASGAMPYLGFSV